MLFGKKRYNSGESLAHLSLMRFKRNIAGMISLCVILFAIIIAISGYLITPDSTPLCNTQILEISTLKPGTKCKFLRVRKNMNVTEYGLFHKMLFGQPSSYRLIPITSVDFFGERLIANIYDQDDEIFTDEYNMADVFFPLSGNVLYSDNNFKFKTVSGSELTIGRQDLQNLILENNIENRTFYLGTDQYGRDMLSRLIIGSRVSLSVGAISVLISLIVGIFLGSMAGFYGGRTDDLIMWFINVVWSIPTLLLVIAITFALGRGFWQIFVAVGLTMWVEVARVVRGQIISTREKEFVEAGFALGYSNTRIIVKHILPNIISPVIVISAANFAAAILIEAGLSFLGIGVQPPMPSWGSMIKEYYSFIILDSAYLAIIPGVAIVILVLAFMTLGNALRDTLDVK